MKVVIILKSNVTKYSAILDQKQFLKMLLANIVSRFGDSLDAIAFSWIMYEVTGNAILISLIVAINFLPTVLFQPFLGVLADKFSKRNMMALSDIARGVMVCITVVLYLAGSLSPLLLMAITFINSTLEAIRMPAGTAILPFILDKDKYAIGMALSQSLCRVFELVGMGLAGGIIALWGSQAALLIDAATFVFSAIVIMLIKYTEVLEKAKISISFFTKRLREGFDYVKSNRTLFFLILLGACINFIAAPLNSFQAIYVADTLKMGPQVLSAMGIALTVGMGLGSFLTPKLMAFFQSRTLILASGGVEVVALLACWLAPLVFKGSLITTCIVIFVICLLGVAAGVTNVIFSAAFAAAVKPEFLARVSGITNAALCSIAPIAALICAALAVFLPVPVIFLVFSVMTALLYFGAAFVKEYRSI